MQRRACVFTVAALALALGGSAACTPRSPQVSSPWPQASAEATVVAPQSGTRWPLTGVAEPATAKSERLALAAVLAAGPANRPLAGVAGADVVYEWAVPGAQVRVVAVLQSLLPQSVGPLGGTTPMADSVALQYRAVTCSLAATGSPQPASVAGSTQTLTPSGSPSVFGAGPTGAARGLYLLAKRAKVAVGPPKPGGAGPARLFFSASTDATQPVGSVSVPLAVGSTVRWTYRAATRSYERSAQGRQQRDALTGKAITATNVIVLWTRAVQDGAADVADLSLTGQGQASIFRDGVRAEGHWRATPDGPPRFTAADGTPILLAPGTTWFEVVPLTANITLK
jgi:hypothetical protein